MIRGDKTQINNDIDETASVMTLRFSLEIVAARHALIGAALELDSSTGAYNVAIAPNKGKLGKLG
eukprot:15332568-Ditylum_brightwellii.AAC.1